MNSSSREDNLSPSQPSAWNNDSANITKNILGKAFFSPLSNEHHYLLTNDLFQIDENDIYNDLMLELMEFPHNRSNHIETSNDDASTFKGNSVCIFDIRGGLDEMLSGNSFSPQIIEKTFENKGDSLSETESTTPSTTSSVHSSKFVELEQRTRVFTPARREEVRTSLALKGEERQRLAKERRIASEESKKTQHQESWRRFIERRLRSEILETQRHEELARRSESAARRAEENIQQTREKAETVAQRVDDVRMLRELKQKQKAIKAELKTVGVEHFQEQRREASARLSEQRNALFSAVTDRRNRFSMERVERHRQRERQREAATQRLEERRRAESQHNHERAKERERRKLEAQRVMTAEAEAKSRRAEERLKQSSQYREERIERLRERSSQKAKQIERIKYCRAMKKNNVSTPLCKFISNSTESEKQQHAEFMEKLALKCGRHRKRFLEVYQSDELVIKRKNSLLKSKVCLLIQKIPIITQHSARGTRQILHELSNTRFSPDDHESIRLIDGFAQLSCAFEEGYHSRNTMLVKIAEELLIQAFSHPKEGKKNISFFSHCGHWVVFLKIVLKEFKRLKFHHSSPILTTSIWILQKCYYESLCSISQVGTSPLLRSIQEIMAEAFQSSGLDQICDIFSTKIAIEESGFQNICSSLVIFLAFASWVPKTKWPEEKQQITALSLFIISCTALQNVLTPQSGDFSSVESISHGGICVIFVASHLINTLVRWSGYILKLATRENGSLLKDNSFITRTELLFLFQNFFQYIRSHIQSLEQMPSVTLESSAFSSSFEDAMNFGITINQMPVWFLKEITHENISLSPLRAALHEILLFLGYISLGDPFNREIFSWGKSYTLLQQIISSMPALYFTSGRHILMPTLLSIVWHSPFHLDVLETEMSSDLLIQFLKEEVNSLSKKTRRWAEDMWLSHRNKVTSKAESASLPQPNESSLRMSCSNDLRENLITQSHSQVCSDDDDFIFLEKKLMLSSFKNSLPDSSGYFRIDRRLPVSVWYGIIEWFSQKYSYHDVKEI